MTIERLDRLEDEFEIVKQLLTSAASYAESANQKIDRLSDRLDAFIEESRNIQAQLAQAEIDRAEFRIQLSDLAEQATIDRAEFRAQLNDLAEQAEIDRVEFRAQLNDLAEQAEIDRAEFRDRMFELAQDAERDRQQAAIDRAEFRTTVQSLLEVLTQRYNGNGQS